MPRPPRPWFRFYVETFPDRKIRRLQPAERWVWAAVLGAARESPEPGRLMIAPSIPMTLAELADYADVPLRLAQQSVAAMAQMGLVLVEDDVMIVPKFTERQYESDDVTARTRKHRERSGNVPSSDVGTFQQRSRERSGNGRRNVPETETDKELSSSARTRPQRSTQIPDNFKIDDGMRAWAGANVPTVDPDRELPRFLDHHRAKGSTFKDWTAAWRSWMRKAETWSTSRPAPALRSVDPPVPGFWRDVL